MIQNKNIEDNLLIKKNFFLLDYIYFVIKKKK